ncbi:helix-turn-helix domain-containing protein [bacterium RCC_150]
MQQNLKASAEESFGASVSAIRTSLDLSQREFAARLTEKGMPVDASAVSRIEKGTRSVRLVEAMAIAEVLDVDLGRLVVGAESPLQEFRRMRRYADYALHDLQENLSQAAFLLYDANKHLREHPELLASLGNENHAAPERPEDYLGWVAQRLEQWKIPDEEYTETDNEEDVAAVIEVIRRFAAKLIGPPRDTEIEAGHGEHSEAG